MRCKDVQRFLTGGFEAGAGDGPASEAQAHLDGCPACAAYAADLAKIRDGVRALPRRELPAAVDARTRQAIAAAR